MDRVALIYFKGATEHMEYSYMTEIQGLKRSDPVVIPKANTTDQFNIGYFSRYSTNKIHINNATKWVVQKVDIEAYEALLFLD